MASKIPRLLRLLAVAVAAHWGSPVVHAQSSTLCVPSGYHFAFFNGVWNTSAEALEGYERLQLLAGDSLRGESVAGSVFYNTSGRSTPGASGFQDVAEVFSQRAAELDGILAGRWEYFWELLGSRETPLWDRLTQALPAAGAVKDALKTAIAAKSVAAIVSLRSNPPTAADYAKHDTRIQGLVVEGKKLLLVGHSQGTLFANRAYSTAVRTAGSTGSIGVVLIAPASVVLNGVYTLADIDLVIKALEAAAPGGTPPSNIKLSVSSSDWTGHTLVGTYLDTSRGARAQIQSQIQKALGDLVTPRRTEASGFFTVTLSWDGSGDVDLHAYEPDGRHVYYNAASGAAGFLDTDNTVAYGPEHFYATCDAAKLQLGTYRFGINNYRGATGRTATVQVAIARGGEIATKRLGVGAERGALGDGSPTPVYSVLVSRSAAGIYSVSVQ